MSEHTPGPWNEKWLSNMLWHVAKSVDDDVFYDEDEEGPRGNVPYSIAEQPGNARLLAKSVNSYLTHCGPKAIDCAEGDLLGDALWAVRESRKLVSATKGFVGKLAGSGSCIAELNRVDAELAAILAKLPEGGGE